MAGTNLKEFDSNGNKVRYDQMGFRDAVKMPSATPETLMVRCLSPERKKLLASILDQIGITKNTETFIINSDEEWQALTNKGTKTYVVCSMGNFRLYCNNEMWTYGTGPIHNPNIIFNDTHHRSNVSIGFDHVLTKIPKLKLEEPTKIVKVRHVEEDEHMFHPAAMKHSNTIQTPRYNAELHRHELKCSVCGMFFDEKDVSSIYSAKTGYVYKCKDCGEYVSPLKKLTYREQLAKASGMEEEDGYSFDGNGN